MNTEKYDDTVEEKIKILSNIPNELIENDKCTLFNSRIILPRDGWGVSRDLNYHGIINRKRINVWISYPLNNTYVAGITIYNYGQGYDYDKVPKSVKEPYIEIAYKIATYLRLMGLHI